MDKSKYRHDFIKKLFSERKNIHLELSKGHGDGGTKIAHGIISIFFHEAEVIFNKINDFENDLEKKCNDEYEEIRKQELENNKKMNERKL